MRYKVLGYLEDKEDVRDNLKVFALMVVTGVLAVIYQCSRLGGAIHQMNRGDMWIKGKLLYYANFNFKLSFD